MTLPLMPRATAVWLVENTSLTFKQIAEFCGLHVLEVAGIADGDVAVGMIGLNPLLNGQLTADEITACEKDPNRPLKMAAVPVMPTTGKGKNKKKYIPVTKRGDKPDAIAWLLKNHPELSDTQISNLIGTTKETITRVRDKTHWNAANIKARDPILLGLTSRRDLEEAIQEAKHHGQTSDKAPQTVDYEDGTH